MRCSDAQKLSSDYLDGELAPESSAAVRGHLRTCSACEYLFEQESELIDAAASLGKLDPPDAIWDAISARIAKEEVRDSQGGNLQRWLRRRYRPLAMAGVGLAAAAAALAVTVSRGAGDSSEKMSVTIASSANEPAPAKASFAQKREAELAEADRHYLASIAELHELLEEDRAIWSEGEAEIVDATLASFRRDAIGQRLAVTDSEGGPDVDSRDRAALYAGYRAEIAFLQSTLAGDIRGRK